MPAAGDICRVGDDVEHASSSPIFRAPKPSANVSSSDQICNQEPSCRKKSGDWQSTHAADEIEAEQAGARKIQRACRLSCSRKAIQHQGARTRLPAIASSARTKTAVKRTGSSGALLGRRRARSGGDDRGDLGIAARGLAIRSSATIGLAGGRGICRIPSQSRPGTILKPVPNGPDGRTVSNR